MHLDFTAEQSALRQQLRAYYREMFTPELRAALDAEWDDMGGSVFRQVVGRMGRDGWLGIGWPKEYGGQGRTPDRAADLLGGDVPGAGAAADHLGQHHRPDADGPRHRGAAARAAAGDPARRAVLRRRLHGARRGHGPRLAAHDGGARRRRVDSDHWVINGQKIYTTHAHDADYIWLAARTDPDAPKHKGITIILVPTASPGFSVTPIRTLGGERTNATYYENVRVPVANTIGPVNGGWTLITSQLNHERMTLATPGTADALIEAVWRWAARVERPGGGRLLDEPWVQLQLARAFAKLEALKVLNWRSAWSLEAGQPHPADASAVKVLGSEFFVECYRLLLEITGPAGLVREGEPGALFGGMLERAYRAATTLTFGGGVNEVQREIIALAALGLPRQRRA
jgi:3-oxocholest-4-en-26-oyl-CoA dehydrogenase alpha subunit